jgi:PEGA domain
MKEHLQPLLLCAAALTVEVGCSSPQYRAQTALPSGYHPPPQLPVSYEARTKKVEILSDPAGARIEVNDNYVGDAPITVEIPQRAGYFTQNTVIRALPTQGGDYVQAKYFSGSIPDAWYPETVGAKRDQIPSRIFFDMRLGPVTPSVDVNVTPQN